MNDSSNSVKESTDALPPNEPTILTTEGFVSLFLNLFKGRLGRAHYILSLILFVLSLIPVALLIITISDWLPQPLSLVPFVIFIMAAFICGLSLHWRRMHDINISGLWLIPTFVLGKLIEYIDNDIAAFLVGLSTIIIALVLFTWPGTVGVNKYGEPSWNKKLKDALLNRNTETNRVNKKPFQFDQKYKRNYFLVTIVAILLITYVFHQSLTNLPLASYQEAPGDFEFIFFPRATDVAVFTDPELITVQGSASRAFVVSGDEIQSGVVAIDILTGDKCKVGYVSLSDLTLIAPPQVDTLVKEANFLYDDCGTDVQFTWSAEQIDDNRFKVEYINSYSWLFANDSTITHRYITDGDIITEATPAQVTGNIQFFALLPFDIVVFFVLSLLAWIISRFIFKKETVTGGHSS